MKRTRKTRNKKIAQMEVVAPPLESEVGVFQIDSQTEMRSYIHQLQSSVKFLSHNVHEVLAKEPRADYRRRVDVEKGFLSNVGRAKYDWALPSGKLQNIWHKSVVK